MPGDDLSIPDLPVTLDLLRALPKTDLHCHLDGSLRLQTILELGDEQGIDLQAGDEQALARRIHMGEIQPSLEAYLEAFAVTLAVLQEADALRRAAHELVLDQAADGVRHVEVRFSPLLNTERGLAPDAVVEAVVDGLQAGTRESGTTAAVIVCAMRHLPPARSLDMAELAARWAGRGVVGFDLAGGEAGHPAAAHEAAFLAARQAHLWTTCHAGEADGASSIADAIHRCGADRIGHGVRLVDDPALLGYVADHRIALECCPSSNLQTGAIRDLAEHPIRTFRARGLRATVNTDNRLITDTTVSRELWLLHRDARLALSELIACVLDGWESAFLPHGTKQERLRQAVAEIERILHVPATP